jgi:hypothetical protein
LIAVAAPLSGEWQPAIPGLGLFALFGLLMWLASREIVLKADGEIIGRGLFWHLDSCANDVRRLVIRPEHQSRRPYFMFYVPQRRLGLPISGAMADRLVELNPALEVQDKRPRKDRGKPW